MKQLTIFILSIYTMIAGHVSGTIIEAPTLDTFKRDLENIDDKTLVMFDVDDTLIYPADRIMRYCSREASEALIKKILKNPEIVPPGKYPEHYFLSTILSNIKMNLVDPELVTLIKALQQKHITTIAFTRFQYGAFGVIPSLADWRINNLKELGIDFGNPISEFSEKELSTMPVLFKHGILFANKIDKGPALIAFLNELKWKPNKIVFLDDRLDYLKSVDDSLGAAGINFVGYHYTVIDKNECNLDIELAERQYLYLAKHGVWLSETEIQEVVKADTPKSPPGLNHALTN